MRSVTGYDSRPDTYEHIGVVRAYLLEIVRGLLHRSQVHLNIQRFGYGDEIEGLLRRTARLFDSPDSH